MKTCFNLTFRFQIVLTSQWWCPEHVCIAVTQMVLQRMIESCDSIHIESDSYFFFHDDGAISSELIITVTDCNLPKQMVFASRKELNYQQT